MKIEVDIVDEVMQFKQVPGFKNGRYEVEIKNMDTRTLKQNSAMYLWLTQIANRLNHENVPTPQILKADVNWTMEKVKYMFFNPIMEMLYQKKSSTKLQKNEFELIINTMTKAFGQRGIELPPYPSMETKDKK